MARPIVCAVLLLALTCMCATAAIELPPGCDKTKIVSCVLGKLDDNHDGRVSIAEFDAFLGSACGRFAMGALTGESVIRHCDVNGDRMLSAVDYEGARACTASDELKRVICMKCDECDRLLAAAGGA
jgi:hypothetical protein